MSERPVEITDPATDRYASLRLIEWWDQERLRLARVMVVGAGALGNEVLKNLALLGVGRVLIVDSDKVEVGNLSRSVLFRRQDAGQPKVDAAAVRLREINPDVRIATLHTDVTHGVGLGVYRNVDVVLGCLDNREARLAVNRACWRVGVPWVDGALDVLMGIVRPFVPPAGACYECTMTKRDYELIGLRYSCPFVQPGDVAQGRMPTTPTMASVIGGLQVQEAVKIMHGLQVPSGSGFIVNGQTYRSLLLAYTRREDCPNHEARAEVVELDAGVDELTVGSLADLVARHTGEDLVLLLDRDIVSLLYCPQCHETEAVYRPFEDVVPNKVACCKCGSNRIPSVITRLVPDATIGALPLRQLGIPPLHILRVEAAGRTMQFELAGDRARVFEGWDDDAR